MNAWLSLNAVQQFAALGVVLHTALALACVWRWRQGRESWTLLLAFTLVCSVLAFVVVVRDGRSLGDQLGLARALVLGLACWAMTVACLRFLRLNNPVLHQCVAWGWFLLSAVSAMSMLDGGLGRPGAQRVQSLFAIALAGLFAWGHRQRPAEGLGLALLGLAGMAVLAALASWDLLPAPLARAPGLVPVALFAWALLRADLRRQRLAPPRATG